MTARYVLVPFPVQITETNDGYKVFQPDSYRRLQEAQERVIEAARQWDAPIASWSTDAPAELSKALSALAAAEKAI
jgi:hypothetical protein